MYFSTDALNKGATNFCNFKEYHKQYFQIFITFNMSRKYLIFIGDKNQRLFLLKFLLKEILYSN